MEYKFTTPEQPAPPPETLLLEWEQLAQPTPSEAYYHDRAGFLEQFRLLSYIMDIDADVNVDVEDVRNVLRQASTLQVGSAHCSGPDRATRAATAALEACRLHGLGPATEQPASVVLLSIVCSRSKELEMDELSTITEHLQTQVGDQAEVIFGHTLADDSAEELRLAVLVGYGPPLAATLAAVPRPALPPEEVFPAAVRLVVEHQKASSTFLQRRLRTGYNHTCRLMDELEAAGVIQRRDERGYRVVLSDNEQVERLLASRSDTQPSE
jgi:Ftsk gamma domain/FtsZ family, C-terminal domain